MVGFKMKQSKQSILVSLLLLICFPSGTRSQTFPNGIEFVHIPGGTFEMGDTFAEGLPNEFPVHTVTLDDYYLSATEVTFDQYDAFCEATGRRKAGDEGWGRGALPVINVHWEDVNAFCRWLSEETGRDIRLPTEAEWEYAAREGGKKVRFGNGKDLADPGEINYDGSEDYKEPYSRPGIVRGRSHPVGSFAPNALGLYDMSGNVWEWCSDYDKGTYYKNSPQNNPQGPSSGYFRVLRGGSWRDPAEYVRASVRINHYPGDGYYYHGFRLAMTF
jgi:sulfatase modifying factor 1